MIDKFWMVVNVANRKDFRDDSIDGLIQVHTRISHLDTPTYIHWSESSAIKECERLTKLLNGEFVVLESKTIAIQRRENWANLTRKGGIKKIQHKELKEYFDEIPF